MTRHWLEVHVVRGPGIMPRLRCENPTACSPDGCPLVRLFAEEVGSEAVRPSPFSTEPLLIGRVEVQGVIDEGGERWIQPLDHHAVTHDARPGGCCAPAAEDAEETSNDTRITQAAEAPQQTREGALIAEGLGCSREEAERFYALMIHGRQSSTEVLRAWQTCAPLLVSMSRWMTVVTHSMTASGADICEERQRLLRTEERYLLSRAVVNMVPGVIRAATPLLCAGCGIPLIIQAHYLVHPEGVPALRNLKLGSETT
jgi:hypothetical protein